MNANTVVTIVSHKTLIHAMVGSHNYNLNTPNSDYDYKLFLLPSFNDLYSGKMYNQAKQSKAVDYTARDIRTLPELFWKGNYNFIEILYSVKVNYCKTLMPIFKERETFAMMNPMNFYNSLYNQAIAKMKNIHNGTSTTRALIEKYGYDTKEACHALRALFTIMRYYNRENMRHAFWYEESDPKRVYLLHLKEGMISENDFIGMFAATKGIVEDMKSYYETRPVDLFSYERLQKIVKGAVQIELGL